MRLGVFGLGNMGAAFVRGVIAAGVLSADDILGFDPFEGAGASLGIRRAKTAEEVARETDFWLIAVKPAGVAPLLESLQSVSSAPPIILSLAAGVPLAAMVQHAPEGALVVRTMPNIAASERAAATAWIGHRTLRADERARVEQVVGAVGVAIELSDESHLHAFTGAVGSGIAWLFLAAEAIADGAVAEGLPRPIARRAAAAAIVGAGAMLRDGEEVPGELKDRVCSPGGTTIEGIVALENAGIRAGFIDAVRQAARRSRELAGK